MKKTYFLIFSLFVLGVFSCKQADYLLYDSTQQNRMTFVQDTLKFNYGMTLDKDVDLLVHTKLMGMVNTQADVPFTVSVNKEHTTAEEGKHFAIPDKNLILKDSSKATVPVDFFKPNLEVDKDYKLTLDLLSDANFLSDDIRRCVIIFGNKTIPAPVWWRTDRLGEYNQDKFILFVSHFSSSKESSSVIYNKIKNTWGENLDKGTAINLLTIIEYRGYVRKYMLIPIYEHYLKTNDDRYKIPNPY